MNMATGQRLVVAAWGCGDCGRLGLGNPFRSVETATIITSLLSSQIRSAVAGAAHTAVVTEDGMVFTWGLNDRGQLGHSPDQQEVGQPIEVPLPEPAIAVAAGHRHTLCLADSGNLWAWGCNQRGQLGLGNALGETYEPRLVASLRSCRVSAVSCGAEHSLALSDAGEVYSWGCGDMGRLGHGMHASFLRGWGGSTKDEWKPRMIRQLEVQNVVSISAGHMHSACVAADGRAFVFGSGRFYQLGRQSDADAPSPVEVAGLRGVRRVSCGGAHTLASLWDGSVAAWGANQHGCLGQGRKGPQQARLPVPVPALRAESVSAGWKHSAALDAGGGLYCWGWGGSQGTAMSFEEGGGTGGQLGLGDDNDRWEPAMLQWAAVGVGGKMLPRRLWKAMQVSCGLQHTVGVLSVSPDAHL